MTFLHFAFSFRPPFQFSLLLATGATALTTLADHLL